MHNTCNIDRKITPSVLYIKREQFLGEGHCERVSRRRGYANGYKSKKVETPAGTLRDPQAPCLTV